MNQARLLIAGIVVLATLSASIVEAQSSNRLAYNPVTGRSEPAAQRSHVRETLAAPATAAEVIIEPASYYDYSVGQDPYTGCGDTACCDPVCCDTCMPSACSPRLEVGFEATFVKPRFENNVAYTTMEADGASFESFSDTEFNYDLEFTPRVFVGLRNDGGVGLRATWWQFDNSAEAATASPPANGFGSITHPTFGAIDISSVVPTDTFAAATDLNAYTIDIEAIKETSFCGWDLGVAGGVRHARAEQGYSAVLRDSSDTLRGRINYRQSVEGFGPTISLSAYRPIASNAGFFCKARGSLLFGDGESSLRAVEDADLTTPFNTSRTTDRDDLLSIGEVQLGFRWESPGNRGQTYRPFFTAALEGQTWNGAGSATSEDGSLGFFGFNAGAGLVW